MTLEIFEVEELERHAGLAPFGMDGRAVRLRPRPGRAVAPRVEPGRQRIVRQGHDGVPGGEPRRPRPVQRAADRADAQADAARHGPVAAPELPLLP